MMYDWSIEIIPKHLDKFTEVFNKGWSNNPSRVYITHLEDSDYTQVINCATRINQLGLRAVPHLGVRNLSARVDVEQLKARLLEAQVREILVLGGNSKKPRGKFTQVLDLLETGVFDSGFDCLHFAGFPEPHPDVKDTNKMLEALREKVTRVQKLGIEARIVTQFCFDHRSIASYIRDLDSANIKAPVQIGVCAPVSIAKLLTFSISCGVGNSIRFLEKQSSSAKGLLSKIVNRYNPNELVEQLEQDEIKIEGLHYFPFGNYAEAFTSRQ